MEVFAILFLFVLLFFGLFSAFPYLLLFVFLLLPRLIPAVRKLPLILYLLADAVISIAAAVSVTVITKHSPYDFTLEHFSWIFAYIWGLMPPILVALFAAVSLNLVLLWFSTFRDAREYRFKPIPTAVSAAFGACLYFVFISIF